MAWIWGALMPHPPLVIPEVGQGREQEAALTLAGIKNLVANLVKSTSAESGTHSDGVPDYLLVLSPHQPYAPHALFMNAAPHLHGSMAPFRAPSVACSLTTPIDKLNALAVHLGRHGIATALGEAPDLTRDHGSLVPLVYLARSFPEQRLPPVIVASPIGLTPEKAYALGKALTLFEDGKRWALLASGDLSHRLTPEAPSGYNPAGRIFDEAVVHALKEGRPDPLMALPAKTLDGAGECGLRSVMVLLGLAGGPLEVFSYEGPFGVGYCTALWKPGTPHRQSAPSGAGQSPSGAGQQPPSGTAAAGTSAAPSASSPPTAAPEHHEALAPRRSNRGAQAYPELARHVVQRYLSGSRENAVHDAISDIGPDAPLWHEAAGCFVSIKTLRGDLRGCMGTIGPTQANLGREIMHNAITAATHDPRFPPMTKDELDGVVFSVDVLGPPEPVQGLDELDPEEWGVIVTKDGRRGLLLPALEGVTSVEQQLGIAAQKAGLPTWKGAEIQRFRVTRYKEGSP